MQTTKKPQNTADMALVDRVLNGTHKSCLSCEHAQVCSPFRGITRFMQEFQKDETTNICFEAYNIAKICKQFTPTLNVLKEGA